MIPKTHPDTSAFTVPAHFDGSGNLSDPIPGLSKLEWFAGLALQGLLAGNPNNGVRTHGDSLGRGAVQLAEDLIDALNKRAERIHKTLLERNRDDTDRWDEQRKLLLIAEKSWRTRMDAGEDPDSLEMQELRKQWESLYR